jgi:hypothetical protein
VDQGGGEPEGIARQVSHVDVEAVGTAAAMAWVLAGEGLDEFVPGLWLRLRRLVVCAAVLIAWSARRTTESAKWHQLNAVLER